MTVLNSQDMPEAQFLNLLDVQKYISLYGKTTSQNCL